jgi:hypothetical protein
MADSARGPSHIQFGYCIQTFRLVIVGSERPLGRLFTGCCHAPDPWARGALI